MTVRPTDECEAGDMSAVSSDHVHTGEPGAGSELVGEEAGVLHPQTVFVILDSAETLNLVR